jgi:hypothetical protein
MSGERRGPIIAGTWLVGLGSVFLIRQLLDLDWAEAWPLFIILAGVAGIVTVALNGVRGVSGLWAFTWPVVTIIVGLVFLAATTGYLSRSPWDVLAEWWPVLLILLGVWFLIGAVIPRRHGPEEQLVVPLAGLGDGAVRIQFGAGTLMTGRAAADNLVDGSFAGGVILKNRGPGRVELSQDTDYGMPWLDKRSDWAVGLSGEVPLDLDVQTGAARAMLDLAELRVRSLKLQSGASETRIRLPRAAGMTTVHASAGAASLTIEVPAGVAARIRSRMAIGSSQVDESRFPRSAGGHESPDYGTAANRADIDLSGGVGSVRVIGTA